MLDTLRKFWAPTLKPVNKSRRRMLSQVPLSALALTTCIPKSAHSDELKVSAAGPLEDGFIEFSNEVEKFKALFRFERDLLDEGTALSSYHFLIYALPENERPQPIVRYEGMEFSYFRRLDSQTWRIHAHNVSYPRDLITGKYISEVRNPFTGETLQVPPVKLLNDPGVLHSPKGYMPLDSKKSEWLSSYFSLRIEGDLIKCEHIRPTPDGWPKMFLESSCSSISRAEFNNPKITSLMYQTSGFYVFPFPQWMQMGSRTGHMLGVWNGRKIKGPAGLPREFKDRLKRENPELLAPRWGEFDKSPTSIIQKEIGI